MLTELEALYKPIAGSSEPGPRQPVETPEQTLERTARLRQAYQELKEDMVEEVNKAETRLVMPAKEARDNLKPMKKIIKKREDKKVRAGSSTEQIAANFCFSSWTMSVTRAGLMLCGTSPNDPTARIPPWPSMKQI